MSRQLWSNNLILERALPGRNSFIFGPEPKENRPLVDAELKESDGWCYNDALGTIVMDYDPNDDTGPEHVFTKKLGDNDVNVAFGTNAAGDVVSAEVRVYSNSMDAEIVFSGCKTESQLYSLVEMLGDAP